MAKKLIGDLGLGMIIMLFSYTGVAKLVELHKFVFQLGRSPFTLLRDIAPVLSVVLPIVELFTVVLLISEDVKTMRFDLPKYITRITRIKNPKRAGLYVTFGLLSMFTIYLGIMLLSGVHLPCTCGGIISKLSWKGHLALNVAFLFLTVFLLRSKQGLQPGREAFVSPNMQ